MPRSVIDLRGYTLQKFTHDLIAGLTVGLVALPLAMAFAISSGLKPEAGLYCAITTGFLISALGGSSYQISGPTGAFVVVVAGIVAQHGVQGLFMCTMMAGVMLIVMGATGLGSAVKFIPRPVVVGFTNGIAVLIASTQVKDFFGLTLDPVPGEFGHRMVALAGAMSTLDPAATAVGAGALALIVLFLRYVRRVPGSIVALVGGTAVCALLDLDVATIGTRFGGISGGLPEFHVPRFRADLLFGLLPAAFTIAMLGAIESLLSAVVADRMTGDRHNPNVELLAQGVGNVVSPLFGGLPATGAIARTATNIRAGARTPVSGMIHGVVLLAVLLFGAPLASHIPLAVLAAILFIVAYNMGEWREIPELLKLSRADISVWAITFFLTVFTDLTFAVEVGLLLAAVLYVRNVTVTTTVTMVTPEYIRASRKHSLQEVNLPDYVRVFRIHGPFLFGSTDKLEVITNQIDNLPPIVMLRLRNMTAIDATGLRALEELAAKLVASGRHLIVCGARAAKADDPPRGIRGARGPRKHLRFDHCGFEACPATAGNSGWGLIG